MATTNLCRRPLSDCKPKSTARERAGVDRKRENELVLEYQRTGSEDVFTQIYSQRVPTLRHLETRFAWVDEDIRAELEGVMFRSVCSYTRTKRGTDWNTFFYTSVLNHVANLVKRRFRKKRMLPDGSDPTHALLRLDEALPGMDDETTCWHDVVPSDKDATSMVNLQALITVMSQDRWLLVEVLADVAACGRPHYIRGSHQYGHVMSTPSGDVEIAIRKDVGIPSELYSVVSHHHTNDGLAYTIQVDSKKLMRWVAAHIRANFASLRQELGAEFV